MTLKKLLLFTIAFACMLYSQVQAASVDKVKEAIVKYSVEMGVDPAITLSIAKAESGFKHELRSKHGAVGVFQLMPSTARRMGLNPYSLDDNIKGGIMYYKSMYKMFGKMELAIAAYNAGPGNVKRYNAVPPYAETKRFVSAIMSDYYYLKAHTDPAVAAYMKSKQQASSKAAVQKVAAKTPVQEVKKDNIEQLKVVDVQIVANAPSVSTVKAPIPVLTVEQSRAENRATKSLPFEVELKSNSVQM